MNNITCNCDCFTGGIQKNTELIFVSQFLSMKLATVNPRLDLNIEGLLSKDV